MDDLLIGYLLNSLDVVELREVAERLQRDPAWQDRLTVLKKTLAPLALDADAPEPPPQLLHATLARVAQEHSCRPIAPPPRRVDSAEEAPARRRFRRADVLAAALLLIVLSALAFPWLVRQWQDYQIRACQRNLAVFWMALENYSETTTPVGGFPQLQEEGPFSFAGIVVPILHDNQVLGSEASILCPAVGKREPDGRTVSDLQLLWGQKGPDEYRLILREVGGTYAYPLGYRNGDQLVGVCRGDGGQPIIADAPGSSEGHENSANHGRRGQNVLFVGGEVRWCTTRTIDRNGDDIFLNQNGEIAAGVSREDVVLGVGDACTVPVRRR